MHFEFLHVQTFCKWANFVIGGINIKAQNINIQLLFLAKTLIVSNTSEVHSKLKEAHVY